MSPDTISEVLRRIGDAPQSAGALTLYALACTLDHERAGFLFKLAKLRDLDGEDRQLAYCLMELMARGDNSGSEWRTARARMDELIRQA